MIKSRLNAVFQTYGDEGGRTVSLGRTGGSQQLLDRASGHENGGRQHDDDENEPEPRLHAHYARRRDPEYPHQDDADRQHRVAPTLAETARIDRGCLRDLARRDGPAPNHFQTYGEETQAKRIADELESVG